jgi:putative endonuclease
VARAHAEVLRVHHDQSRALYTGVTSDLPARVKQHQLKLLPGFSSRYNITKLVWFEEFPDAIQAIEAEKRIKGWRRSKKVALIEDVNPQWADLSFDDEQVTPPCRTPRRTSE